MHGQLAWPSTAPPRARRVAAERAATRARRAGVARAYAGASLQPASVPSERAVEGGDGVGAGAWRSANGVELKDLPPPPRGVADDPQLHNPLERLERLGCGWMGAIFEMEGVLVEDRSAEHRQAWLALAAELGKPPPPAFQLKRVVGMKSSQVVSEVFCWAREPGAVRKLAARKDAAFRASASPPAAPLPGVLPFLERLRAHGVPCAVSSSDGGEAVRAALASTGLAPFFAAVVCGEDVQRGRPDPEPYLYAAASLRRPPQRCFVVGSGNASVEAAREGGLRCVALAGAGSPAYELAESDLVVRRLDELTLHNLKQLFAVESERPGDEEPQVEMEEEEEDEEGSGYGRDRFGSNLF